MKFNRFHLSNDGMCLSSTTSNHSTLVGKIFLLLPNLILIGIFSFAAYQNIMGITIFSAVLLIFMIKFTLWNIYGKEYLQISKKSVRFQYDYGFFKTNPKIIKTGKKLLIRHSTVYQQGKLAQLSLLLMVNDEDDFEEEIYQCVLPISSKDAESFKEAIHLLYTDRVTYLYEMPPIHMN